MPKLFTRSCFIITALCFVYSLSAYAKQEQQCAECADLVAKINNFVKRPDHASDKQFEDLYSILIRGKNCDCDLSTLIESLFVGAPFERIKKYYREHPERLNDKDLPLEMTDFGNKVANAFVSIVAENIEKVKSSIVIAVAGYGIESKRILIDALEKCNSFSSLVSLFVLIVWEPKNDDGDLHNYGLNIIKKKLTSMFPNKAKAFTLEYVFLLFLYKYAHGSLPAGSSISSQTAQHLLSITKVFGMPRGCCYGREVPESVLQFYVSHKKPRKVLDQIIVLEQQYANAGYYTFVHGQRWEYRLAEQWYTWLWEVEQNRSAGDFQFIHCRKLKKEKLEKQKQFRKEIIEKGRINFKERKRLLFLNAPFFGNLMNEGSCTAYFAYSNRNINSLLFSLEDIFKMFDCSAIYTKYKSELEALEKEHATLSRKHGQVLLLAIPKKIVKECVYCARPGGYRRSVIVDGKSTENVQVILEALRSDASKIADPDQMEFCLTLTDDMLTPDSGIIVRSLPMVDEAKIKAFDTKARKLFERIKKELKQQLEKEKKVSRCVEQINQLLENAKNKDIAALKAKINREILTGISDDEKKLVKQRMLEQSTGLSQIRTVPYSEVEISSSGLFVAKISEDVNVWKVHNLINDAKFSINYHFGDFKLRFIESSPDERYLVFSSLDQIVILDRHTGLLKEIDNLNIWQQAISDKYFVFYSHAYPESTICIYDLEKREFVQKIKTNYYIYRLLISPDSQYLIGEGNGNRAVWNLPQGILKYSYECGNGSCLLKINDKYLIAEKDDRTINLLDLFTGKRVEEVALPDFNDGSSICNLNVSGGTKLLYLVQRSIKNNNWEVCERNIADGKEKVHMIKTKKLETIVTFTENYMITRSADGKSITIWSYNTDKENLINQLFA